MHKIPKPNRSQAPSADSSATHSVLSGKKPPSPPPVLTRVLKPTAAERAAKGTIEAAERDRKLDLIFHRFAQLL
jgi:hypothetical protein